MCSLSNDSCSSTDSDYSERSDDNMSWDSLIKFMMNENHEGCVKHGHCLFPMESPKFASCPMHTGGKNMVLAWSSQRASLPSKEKKEKKEKKVEGK